MDHPAETNTPATRASTSKAGSQPETEDDQESSADCVFLVSLIQGGMADRSIHPVTRAYRKLNEAILWCEAKLELPRAIDLTSYRRDRIDSGPFENIVIQNDAKQSFSVVETVRLDEPPSTVTAQTANQIYLVFRRQLEYFEDPDVFGEGHGINAHANSSSKRPRWELGFRLLYVCTTEAKAKERMKGELYLGQEYGRSGAT
ncbi:MAG: hypothetical protein Q9169_005666, partial [Polycauliona sp. 2 TL-2023]